MLQEIKHSISSEKKSLLHIITHYKVMVHSISRNLELSNTFHKIDWVILKYLKSYNQSFSHFEMVMHKKNMFKIIKWMYFKVYIEINLIPKYSGILVWASGTTSSNVASTTCNYQKNKITKYTSILFHDFFKNLLNLKHYVTFLSFFCQAWTLRMFVNEHLM